MTGARTWLLLLLDFLLIGKTDFSENGDVQAQLNCPEEVERKPGQDVTLNCSLKPQQDDEQFMGRVSVGNNCNLSEGRLSVRISKLTTADRGTYSCYVHIGENQPSCHTELRIADPKEVSENSNKTPRDTDSNDNNNGNSTNKTTGISVGISVGIIMGYCFWKRRRNRERQERSNRKCEY